MADREEDGEKKEKGGGRTYNKEIRNENKNRNEEAGIAEEGGT